MLPGPPPSWPAPDASARAGGRPEPVVLEAPPPASPGSPWGWVVLVVIVVAAAGVGAWLWLRDDDGGVSTPSSTAVPTTVATRPTTTNEPATTTGPTTATSVAAPSSVGTTAPVAPTVAPTAAPPTANVSVVGGVEITPDAAPALAAAQAVTSALASGDWSAVRRLSPDEGRTDTQLETAYGALTDVAIVPARIQRANGQVDLRLGLVAHEEHATGPATALLCAHWRVDPAAGTVDRVSSVRLRLEPGRLDPATVTAELAGTCATYPLR
jgi:hypothetical protein